MKNILFIVLSITVLSNCGKNDNDNPFNPVQIIFAGVGDYGIFDPSLAKDPVSNRIWMSYSEVDQSPLSSANKAINTRLAYSDNFGSGWSDAAIIVNQSADINTGLPSPNDVGTWEWGAKIIHVFDPEGNRIELWSQNI